MTDQWWPLDYTNPAFQVRRRLYGLATGGDYVRGSSVITLPQTALRYPTETPGFSEAQDKGLLFARPFDHITVEIMWGWPITEEEVWTEVALVRSAFGHPQTPQDGQTVFRALRSDFVTEGVVAPAPLVYDQPLPSGRWYYYSLFFRDTPVNWMRTLSESVLLPKNYRHAELLWEGVPPYYQWLDDNFRVNDGFLRQWLAVFGFELDTAREFVESVQKTHQTDWTPVPLLKELGANHGCFYESGLGDILYRSLISNLSGLRKLRGTKDGLQGVIEASSKYQCEVTTGANLTMLPDDSDFYYGTGRWGAKHPDTDFSAEGTSVVPTATRLVKAPANVIPPAGAPKARGVLRVDTTVATETNNLLLTVGDTIIGAEEIIPTYSGIPVRPGDLYGVSIWVKTELASQALVTPYMLWFDSPGAASDLLQADNGFPATAANTNWYEHTQEAVAPAGSVYLIPALYFSARIAGGASSSHSAWIDLSALMVYSMAAETGVVAVAPDQYLTVGDPNEKMGAPNLPTFPGYLIGEP